MDALHEDVEIVPTRLAALDSHVKDIGNRLASELASLHATIDALVRAADEMRQVVEPLQGATDCVGRVADKLPGGES
jgi:methyl coenzyme M reductase gamma subunit